MCCWIEPSLPDRRRWEYPAAIILYSRIILDDDEIKRKKLNEAIDGFFWSHPNLPG
jgi:hypothetical protein